MLAVRVITRAMIVGSIFKYNSNPFHSIYFMLISFPYLIVKGNKMSDNLSDKIKAIIANKLSVDIAKVTDDARFVDDFGADSLDTVDLIMALEEAFDIEIPNKEGQDIQSVKDAIAFIQAKVNK
jgi:acyl carrier protein